MVHKGVRTQIQLDDRVSTCCGIALCAKQSGAEIARSYLHGHQSGLCVGVLLSRCCSLLLEVRTGKHAGRPRYKLLSTAVPCSLFRGSNVGGSEKAAAPGLVAKAP